MTLLQRLDSASDSTLTVAKAGQTCPAAVAGCGWSVASEWLVYWNKRKVIYGPICVRRSLDHADRALLKICSVVRFVGSVYHQRLGSFAEMYI